MMSYRHSIVSTASDASCDVNNNANGLLTADNLLRLALKKPKSWNWELTTSSSSPNISFPRIQLFDGVSGELMVEVDRPDCVIRSDCSETGLGTQGSSPRELVDARPARYRRSRTSLVKEKLSTSGESLADIFHQLQSKGLGHKLTTSGSQYRLLNGDPDNGHGTLQKSKSASAISVASEVSPTPIARRRSRRSLASRSSSILERISEFYGRSSTDEEEPPTDIPPPPETYQNGVTIEELPGEPTVTKPHPKIYKLVRSNVGTLMVREESFHTQRSLRRRQREHGADGASNGVPPVLVEMDDRTDRPRPLEGAELERLRYEREITHIDGLLSRVMLSHDLQTEELHQPGTPSIRVTEPPEENFGGSGALHHRRRHRGSSRRSVSVGGTISSPIRQRPNSSTRQRHLNGAARRSSSSSSESADRDRSRQGSRSSSQKRRGRTRHRNGDDPGGSHRAAISNASPTHSRSPNLRDCPNKWRTGWWDRRYSADTASGHCDTQALERFRASLLEERQRATAASGGGGGGGCIANPSTAGQTAPTIQCAAGSEPVQCSNQLQPTSTAINSASSTSSSSTSGTLSTLSGPSDTSERVAPAPLARSISAPVDRSYDQILENIYRTLLPTSGDELRRRYAMEPQRKQIKLSPMEEMAPPGRPAMVRVVEQVISNLPHKQVATRPPTGRRSLTPQDVPKDDSKVLTDAAGGAGASGSAGSPPPPYPGREATGTARADDFEMAYFASELVKTVEPPYRGRRTLKYYSRRQRSSIHHDSN